MRTAINSFLGAELIPVCAVGSELNYIDGSLVIKTFSAGGIVGYRKLDEAGELVNIIIES